MEMFYAFSDLISKLQSLKTNVTHCSAVKQSEMDWRCVCRPLADSKSERWSEKLSRRPAS